MRIEPQDGPYRGSPSYGEATRLEVIEVKEPSYRGALDWMRVASGPHVSYDFWQRGNYTRRLIHQRYQGITPIHVEVSYVDQMRWAYRRLALLGLPIDFVYCGSDCATGSVLHRVPWDYQIDAGWGYALFAVKGPGGEPIGCSTGDAHLLPQAAVDWLVEEASEAFLQGNLSIAPAELVGLDPNDSRTTLSPLASLAGGMPLVPEEQTAEALMDLELPYLDQMSPGDFSTFLEDHADDLERFRKAFRQLVTTSSDSEAEARDFVEEIRHEVAELMESERSKRLERTATVLKGAMRTVRASLVVARDPLDPIGWSVAAGAAGETLVDLWKQARSPKPKPFSLLWKLGITSPDKVKTKRTHDYAELPPLPKDRLEPQSAHHWLCPPRAGARLIVPANKRQSG